MYLFGLRINKKKPNHTDGLLEKIKPFLLQGSIILSSDFTVMSANFSPSPIKHCSFCQIENGNYYITEISEIGFKKIPISEFLKYKQDLYIFHYKDINLMSKSMDYIEKYKNKPYGFFSDSQEYCYKLVFTLYNDLYDNKFKKMSEFLPVFSGVGNIEYLNSNSIFKSKRFIGKCCIINNKFIVLGKRKKRNDLK